MSRPVPVTWGPREPPLEPGAVIALGEVATQLALRVLQRPGEDLAGLSGVAGPEVLCVLGPAEQLPWTDGAVYLGVDLGAPGLWLPTFLSPSVPLELVARALAGASPSGPVAFLPRERLVVPLAGARPLHRPALEAYLASATRAEGG